VPAGLILILVRLRQLIRCLPLCLVPALLRRLPAAAAACCGSQCLLRLPSVAGGVAAAAAGSGGLAQSRCGQAGDARSFARRRASKPGSKPSGKLASQRTTSWLPWWAVGRTRRPTRR
jgi:hypothetical protein